MGVTNFPNGVNIGSAAGGTATLEIGGAEIGVPAAQLRKVVAHPTAAGKLVVAGTVTVPTGGSGTAFASGLTTVDFVLAAPYFTVEPVAGYAGCGASKTGGSVTVFGVSSAGTASTASGTATWLAIGS